MDDRNQLDARAASVLDGREGPLRLLVAARRPLTRAGLRGLVAERHDLLIVGEAAAIGEAAHRALDLTPDLVLAAWEGDDVEEIAEFAEAVAPTRLPVVLIGDLPAARELSALLRAGISGFLLSDVTAEMLAAGLASVRLGLLVLDPLLGRTAAITAPADDVDESEPLTEREREVLAFVAQGLPNKTIASRLRISEHTVKFHVGSILAKLNATSRTEAVTRAARRGLLVL